MNSKILIFFLFTATICNAQKENSQVNCTTSKANNTYFKNNPAAYQEYLNFNKINLKNKTNSEIYAIPVVFHVYGTDFNGKNVNDDLIKEALRNLNKDFQGLNDDFNQVNDRFKSIRGTISIEFKLAQKDPDGNASSGILHYNKKSGYGNGSSSDIPIKGDAWDNYKYMNVYIQNDLYNNDVTNDSGVSWYPSTSMSDENLARVVYNGAYLATNTSKEFASVLTHEFGHWLNLVHTFEGECTGTDYVDDTPPENGNHDVNCFPGTNCDGDYVNFENYMGYNGASGCYKMFTQGQISRIKGALEHPARKPLWQEQNLIDTGLKFSEAENIAPTIVFNSPNNNDSFEEKSAFVASTTVNDANGSGDINRVEFFFNSELVKTVKHTPFEYIYTNLQIGNHTLKAMVFDNGELFDTKEISISIFKKINFPEVKWVTENFSYTNNNVEFSNSDKIRRIEIFAYNNVHKIIVKGPNDFKETYTTKLGEAIIIENITKGTWTIEIPSENKKITKTFE